MSLSPYGLTVYMAAMSRCVGIGIQHVFVCIPEHCAIVSTQYVCMYLYRVVEYTSYLVSLTSCMLASTPVYVPVS